jgi:hypothetical protein
MGVGFFVLLKEAVESLKQIAIELHELNSILKSVFKTNSSS